VHGPVLARGPVLADHPVQVSGRGPVLAALRPQAKRLARSALLLVGAADARNTQRPKKAR